VNPQLADLADLREWADRLGSRSRLPILLRRLLLASTGADVLRAPGGDAVGEHGWDITLDLPDGVPPFAPAGSSRWEGGVGIDPRKKAQSDFKKRTDETAAAVRATQTFVFFTPRHFEDSEDWIQAKVKEGRGWADIKVVDGVMIEEWLEFRPDVHIWFSELIGKTPADVRPLSTWWDRWSNATSPALPPGVLTAGRGVRAQELRASLRSSAGVVSVMADTTEEALAFVAACLHDGPAPELTGMTVSKPVDEPTADSGTSPGDAADGSAETTVEAATGTESGGSAQAGGPEVEPLPERAALLARAVIVESAGAWARLAQGAVPLILIPTFADPDVGSAAAAGHHVVVPAVSRHSDNPLPRIRIDDAAEAFRSVNVEFARSYEYARSARRSLSGLRRRLANSGLLHDPEWASGTAPSTLGPLLLLGGWREDHPADIELIEELTETKWRKLARDLQTVTRMPDPPVRVEAKPGSTVQVGVMGGS
jgi:hypothetical protein